MNKYWKILDFGSTPLNIFGTAHKVEILYLSWEDLDAVPPKTLPYSRRLCWKACSSRSMFLVISMIQDPPSNFCSFHRSYVRQCTGLPSKTEYFWVFPPHFQLLFQCVITESNRILIFCAYINYDKLFGRVRWGDAIKIFKVLFAKVKINL